MKFLASQDSSMGENEFTVVFLVVSLKFLNIYCTLYQVKRVMINFKLQEFKLKRII